MKYINEFRQALMDEIRLPDFKGRHLYLTQLRMIVYAIHWAIFLFLYPELWTAHPYVPLIFNLGFMGTAVCYYLIIKKSENIIFISLVEVIIDVFTQTCIIYILGVGNTVAVLLLYGFYVIACGAFFGYLTALVATLIVIAFYSGLIQIYTWGLLDPFEIPQRVNDFFSVEKSGPIINLLSLSIVLGLVIYATKIVHQIVQIKEKALESRNVQLTALNRIGSIIKGQMKVEEVVQQVLKGVTEGLGFDLCLIALINLEKKKAFFFGDQQNPELKYFEKSVGYSLSDMSISLEVEHNKTLISVLNKQMLIRNELFEVTRGIKPDIPIQKAAAIQQELNVKKFVTMPLIVEKGVIGALIGVSRREFVEESIIEIMDSFANQAALAIESSQLIEQLKLKNDELKQANKVKSDFLAMMSHELRTPLNAVIGYSEVLLDGQIGEMNEEQKHFQNEVLRNSNNLLELINNILDLAKMESGKLKLSPSTFSLQDLIEDVHQTLSSLIDKKNQVLNINCPTDLPFIEADYNMLRQVLINILGNSNKYTAQSGKIDFEVCYFNDLDFKLQYRDYLWTDQNLISGRAFSISIRDNGVGIGKSELDFIFEAFQQIHSPYTREHEGTGLGLTLCQQMVELHQGVIAVKSELGKGSEFVVILPASQEENPNVSVS